jgi:hypothetical protein
VCLTWIYFRAPDLGTASAVLQRIGSGSWTVDNISAPMLWVMLAGVAAHLIPASWFEKTVQIFVSAPAGLQALVQGVALAAAVLLIEFLSGKGAAGFVYGNF